jgi:hypothetical protein
LEHAVFAQTAATATAAKRILDKVIFTSIISVFEHLERWTETSEPAAPGAAGPG